MKKFTTGIALAASILSATLAGIISNQSVAQAECYWYSLGCSIRVPKIPHNPPTQFQGGPAPFSPQEGDISLPIRDGMIIHYFRNKGQGIVTNPRGYAIQNSGVNGWRSTWNIIFAIRPDMVIFYDAAGGHSDIYSVDGRGALHDLYHYDGWKHDIARFSLEGTTANGSAVVVRITGNDGHSGLYAVDNKGIFHDY